MIFYIKNEDNSIDFINNASIANSRGWSLSADIEPNEVIYHKGKCYLPGEAPEYSDEERFNDEFIVAEEQYILYINNKLSDFANSYKYDSIESMVSYKDSLNEIFAKEALIAIKFRDEEWENCFTYLNECKTNKVLPIIPEE